MSNLNTPIVKNTHDIELTYCCNSPACHDDTDKYKLFNYEEIPDWYKDNKYIKYGYRAWNQKCSFYSNTIFNLHNESLNIWTHLTGFLLFIVLTLLTFGDNGIYREGEYRLTDLITMGCFMASSMTCFLTSSVMHCFFPCSETSCNRLVNCDYCAILLLIINS